jgi:hypothetical protein
VAYLLRRAWWQGRTEFRRGNARAGLLKELRRLWYPHSVGRGVLAACFGAVVLMGIAFESIRGRATLDKPGEGLPSSSRPPDWTLLADIPREQASSEPRRATQSRAEQPQSRRRQPHERGSP